MALEHPCRERRVRAEHAGTGDQQRIAVHGEPGEQPEQPRAAQVDGERAPREVAGDALGDPAVEREPQQCARAADRSDGHPHRCAHAITRTRRTIAAAAVTATKPAAMLAAAYPVASPRWSRSSIRSSSTCIVEKVVKAPQNPVPSNGLRYIDTGRRSRRRTAK